MSKWISDAYIKHLMKNNRLLQGNCEYELYKQEVEKTVDAMPHIDIVRCGECKHWNMVSNGCMRNPSVEGWQADDFCSYGKRNEGE
jgi:hypothetical protein